MNPETINPGALVLAAPPNLPDELVAHLPAAEARASQNMEAVKAASTPELESLRQQLRQAQTPAVPAAAKVIRFLVQDRVQLWLQSLLSSCGHGSKVRS